MSNNFYRHDDDRMSSQPSPDTGPLWPEVPPANHTPWPDTPHYVHGEKPAQNVKSKRRASARAGRHIILEQELRLRRSRSLGTRLHDGFLALNDEDERL